MLEELTTLVECVNAVDLRDLEQRPARETWESVGSTLQGYVSASLKLLERVVGRYDTTSEPVFGSDEPSDEYGAYALQVDTISQQRPSGGRVADLAFMARLELRDRARALDGMHTHTLAARPLLSTIDRARRCVRKSLTAVAAMLAAVEGLDSSLCVSYELETSLEVRRAYARLRASIEGAKEPSDAEMYRRLRGVGTRIAMLIGRSLYQQLRVHDRCELRDLQTRILAWLRTDTDSEDGRIQGRRLWQDIAGYARVLAMVSQRQELLQHDARLVTVAVGVSGRGV